MKNLAIKSFLGMLNLFVIMSACIFWPAGTFHFLQGWLYLSVFFGGVTVITVYIFINDKRLLQSRLKVGTTAEKRTAQKIIQGFASIGFIGMYIVAGFDHRYQWSSLPEAVWIASDIMLIVTMALLFIVFRKNTFLSATIEVQQNQSVITDGPYALVRHPMYSAALLLFIFTPLALGSLYGIIAVPFMILVLAMRCIDEEKALSQELDKYSDYCKTVRYRLIPCVW
ncbi:MAG: isoprenylcysteine carboxylmethyltransferase family protein [Bacteroidota bacterium]